MAICHNKKYESEFAKLMHSKGHACYRIAGSGSALYAVCDCVLYIGSKHYLVEVKATRDEVFYFRKGVREQIKTMADVCKKHGLIPLLALKFKHRGWNLVEVESYDKLEHDKRRDVDVYCAKIT